jgi:phosphoglycolate phosphatase-like HAD superfamily hydrolase
MPVAVVVFDMDGTLANNEAMTVRAAEDGLRAYYASRGEDPVIPSPETIRSLVGLPALEYFAGLVPPGLREDAEAVMASVQGKEEERLRAGEGRLFDGVPEVIEALRERGDRLGLVSNCMRPYLEANLEHVLRRDWFAVALCLEDHPTKIENVRRALGLLGGGAGVMVGDRGSDLEAGRAAGLRTVGCLYGFGRREDLVSADRTIESIRDLVAVLPEILP